ncbi:MAG: hypothetical protein KDH48_06615, partial [Rhodoferax sp.]|nr:hypothetical protein [Rhodoferax sp.]
FAFNLPAATLDPFSPDFDRKRAVKPVGTKKEKGGFGGAIFISVLGNTTHATVGDGAHVYSGSDGGFNIKAEEAITGFAFNQAGGEGGKYAIGGTVSWVSQTSDTLAQLSGLAFVTGRNARIYAGSLETQIAWNGGIAKGEGLGVGVSIAIHQVDRTTRAVIGDAERRSGAADPRADVQIDVSDAVDVKAIVTGRILTFGMAGAFSSSEPQEPVPADTPLKAQKILGVDAEPPPTGISVAAAVAVNRINDTTQASIVDAGHIQASGVNVDADDQLFQLAITGGAAVVKTSENNSKSLAGAFSYNEIGATTLAYVLDTHVTTTDAMQLGARRSGDLVSISAGGAFTNGDDGIAIAGSFSLNMVYNDTQAYLDGVDADIGGNLTVRTSDNARIIAVGGGVAYGGKAGVGLGVGANILGSDARPTITRSYIQNGSIGIGGNTLEVSAINDNPDSDPRIFAFGAGVGVSGKDGKVGLGAMLSVNLTTNKTEAWIKNASVTEKAGNGTATNTTVKAVDDSGIVAVAGAVGVSSSNAIGAAIGYNEIDNDVSAYLDNVSLTSDGALTIEATSDAEIGGVAIGVAATTGGSGKLAGAGSLLINQISNTMNAYIVDTVGAKDAISVGGDITVTAADNSVIVSIAGGIAVSPTGKTAIGAAVSFNVITNQVRAYVEDATLDARNAGSSIQLSASSSATLVSVAMGVGGGGVSFALGGSLTVNSIANSVDAHIRNSSSVEAGRDVSVRATESDTLVTVAGGFAAATSGGGNAVGAAIAYNYIGGSFDVANPEVVNRDSTATDQITAYIDNTQVVAGRDVVVVAGYQAPAGAVPASVQVWDESERIDLPEDADSHLVSVTVGGAAADQFALGGSVSMNIVAHDITAYISGTRSVTADGSVLVSALDDLTMTNVAGGVALGQNAVGAGVALQVDKSQVAAYVGAGAVVDAKGNGAGLLAPTGTQSASGVPQTSAIKGLAVTAVAFENIHTVAVGGAAAARASVAGSAAVTVLARSTTASIAENARINQGTAGEHADQGVLVLASDRTNHVGVAGSVALGGTAGIGAGVDTGVFVKNTKAWIASGARVDAQSDVRLQAWSDETIVSVAAAGGGGLDVGIAGAIDVYVLDITTQAYIEGGKTVDAVSYAAAAVAAGGNVQVAAEDANEIDIVSGSIAAGGTAGIGGAAAVPVVTKNTQAWIGHGVSVDAKAQRAGIDVRDGTVTIGSGAYGGTADGQVSPVDIANDDVTDAQLTAQRIATPGTRQNFTGVAVTAVNRDDIAAYSVGAGFAGTTAVQVSASVNVMHSTTQAYIADNARINQDDTGENAAQSVLVAAANDYQHLGVAGGLSIAGNVAVTPGALVNVVTNTTKAWVGKSAQVDAMRDVEVRAQAAEDVLSISISVAGSGTVSVAGAVSVFVLNNTTHAFVDNGAMIDATGNLLVTAVDATDLDVVAGAVGIGLTGGGVGASIGVNVVNKDTRAWIASASVDAKGQSSAMTVYDGTLSDAGVFGLSTAAHNVRGVAVIAQSSENLVAVAAAGAGGANFGVAGSITVNVLDSDTRAFIAAGANVNVDATDAHANQDVHVAALNDLTMRVVDGTVAGGAFGGVSGGVDVGIVRNDTTAFIAGNDVRARRDIAVSALADRDVGSYVVSAAGGAVGVGAAIAVYALGGNLTGSYAYDTNNDG